MPFILLPTWLAERLVLLWVGQAVGAPWVVPAGMLGVAAGVALVNSVLSAFAVVYDACLFAALQKVETGAEGSRARQAYRNIRLDEATVKA
jgi:hypothetical protein